MLVRLQGVLPAQSHDLKRRDDEANKPSSPVRRGTRRGPHDRPLRARRRPMDAGDMPCACRKARPNAETSE